MHISIPAILAGIGVQTVSGFVLSLGIGLVLQRLTSLDFQLLVAIIGLISVALGGASTAYLSSQAPLLDSALAGLWMSISFGLGSAWFATHAMWSVLFVPASFLVSSCAALVVAYLRRGVPSLHQQSTPL